MSRISYRQLPLLLVIAGFLCLVPCRASGQKHSVEQIPIEYHGMRDRLDRHDMRTLASLARKCGVTNIEKIDVHYALPTDKKIILLREKGVIAGRTIRTRTLSIDWIKWNTPLDDSPEATKKRLNGAAPVEAGGFRVIRDYVETQRILRVENKELRVRVDETIPTDLAEDMVSKILKAEVIGDQFSMARLKESLDRGDKLTTIQRSGADEFRVEIWQFASAVTFTFSRDATTGALKIIATGSIVI